MCQGLTWVRSILARSKAARRSSEARAIHLSYFGGKFIRMQLQWRVNTRAPVPDETPLYISRIVRANNKSRES